MEEHPPLCPKTPESFRLGLFKIALTCSPRKDYGYCLSSLYESDRRFLARYQASAWLDRANRWSDLTTIYGKRYGVLSKEHHARCGMWQMCVMTAHAWREWEKLKPPIQIPEPQKGEPNGT